MPPARPSLAFSLAPPLAFALAFPLALRAGLAKSFPLTVSCQTLLANSLSPSAMCYIPNEFHDLFP
jgi:hypothetical protein